MKIDDIERLADNYGTITKSAAWQLAAFFIAWTISGLAGGIRNSSGSMVELQSAINELLDYIQKEMPDEGWGKHAGLMSEFLKNAAIIRDNVTTIQQVPDQPDPAYIQKLNAFLNSANNFLSSMPAVITALDDMQAWYAKPGRWLSAVGLNFGIDLTDLQSIKRLLGQIQGSLSIVITNLNQVYTKFQQAMASPEVQARAQAAPAAAAPEAEAVSTGTEPFSQMADLTL